MTMEEFICAFEGYQMKNGNAIHSSQLPDEDDVADMMKRFPDVPGKRLRATDEGVICLN